jgi:hypothetical protein
MRAIALAIIALVSFVASIDCEARDSKPFVPASSFALHQVVEHQFLAGRFGFIDDILRALKPTAPHVSRDFRERLDNPQKEKGFFYYVGQLILRLAAGFIGVMLIEKMASNQLRLSEGDRWMIFQLPIFIVALIFPFVGVFLGLAIGLGGILMAGQSTSCNQAGHVPSMSDQAPPGGVAFAPPPSPRDSAYTSPPPIPHDHEV